MTWIRDCKELVRMHAAELHRPVTPFKVRQLPQGAVGLYWGTLDADLAYSNTTGVAVTLDNGGSQDGVLYPPDWGTGTLASGSRVLIGQVSGPDGVKWYVINTPCATS